MTLGAPLGGALDGFGHVFAGEDDFHFVGVGSAVACLELVFPWPEVVVLDVVADHLARGRSRKTNIRERSRCVICGIGPRNTWTHL